MQPVDRQNGNEQLLQRYLLGDLSEEEQDRVEEAYFADDDYLDRLLVAEHELIDRYLRGKLAAAERLKFERNYLTTPEKRQRVALVKQLHETAQMQAAVPPIVVRREEKTTWQQWLLAIVYPPHPVTRYALALGVLAVMFGGALLVNQTIRLRSELKRAEQEQAALRRREEETRQQLAEQQQRSNELARALEEESEQRRLLDEALSRARETAPAIVPAFELGFGEGGPERRTFGPSHGVNKAASLVIPKAAKLVRLTFKINQPVQQNCSVAMLTPDGAEVWSRSHLPAHATRAGQAVTLHIPARLLTPGQYVFALRIQKADGSADVVEQYPVKVERPGK
jgi:hypothetical protein